MPAAPPPRALAAATPHPTPAPVSLDRLFPVVYDELRRVAHRQLRGEVTGHTLGTTALVHEVYLRLTATQSLAIADRAHFFALAARAMRHVLVDSARRFRSERRGGGAVPGRLDERDVASARASELLDLNEALEHLEVSEPRQAQVVELRFFAGLTEEEAAESLGVTARTVRRDWVAARQWLYDRLHGGG